MTSRDRTEEHRASTPLELLYDLCFVVVIARAASLLHHASAYDNDDAVYRLLVFLQMVGVLVLAAGAAPSPIATSTSCSSAISSCARDS